MILNEILKELENNNDKTIYINNQKEYTYKDMYEYVKNMYFYLKKITNSKTPIIVYGHKSIFMIVCFLACSFLGIPYVPIDESFPKKRILNILNNVNPQIILNTSYKNFFEYNCEKCRILECFDIINICNNKEKQKEKIKILMKKEDLYYIIFTSGTTGSPKGVKITYNNLNSFVSWMKKVTNIKENVILNQSVFSFDLSVADIYLTLTTSSSLIALELEEQLDYLKIFKVLKENNIEIAIMTPSFADILISDKQFNSTNFPNLKKILFCGETLQINTVKELFKRFKGIKIINSYGPTECTVAVSSNYITKSMLKKYILPIGRVKKEGNINILDENLNFLKEGKVGQIAISGKSVGAGYFNDEVNTNKKFVKLNDKITYLTGDLGYIQNGRLFFEKRKDNQIKYKGYRIELSDIERNFYKLNYIDKVVVAPKIQNSKVVRLVAYVKVKQGTIISSIELKNDLQKFLPKYMIPSVVFLKEFPININGKCDIKKLEEKISEK